MLKFYFEAKKSGLDITFSRSLLMSIRKTATSRFLDNYIIWKKYDLDLNLDVMEAYYLSGVNIEQISKALKLCADKKIDATITELTSIDLSGNDLIKVVNSSSNGDYLSIDIKEENPNFRISLGVEYKQRLSIVNVSKGEISKKVEERIRKFITENKDLDNNKLEELLKRDIIGADYWKKEFNSELLKQELTIK